MKLAIAGLNGRMGSFLYRVLSKRSNYEITYGIDMKIDYKSIPLYKKIREDLTDILIDFTEASFSYKLIKEALNKRIKVISGTTGFTKSQIEELKSLSEKLHISLILVPNYALGASILYHEAANLLELFDSYDIIESHNINKRDIPSGTAKEYARLLNISEDKIQALRLNEVIATHEIILNNPGERLIIKHEILSRDAFLKGFLQALDYISDDEYHEIVGLKDFYDVFH